MSGCNTPAANKEGSIRTYDALSGPGLVLYFITDDNGYFKINHNEKGSISKFYVNVEGASDVLRVHYYPEDHKKLGDVYIFPPSASYYLYLDVDSAYTENDTLYYRDLGYPQNGGNGWSKKLPGPFVSGIIDTVDYALDLNGLPASHNSSTASTMFLGYNINYNSVYENKTYVESYHCQDEYQNVTLKIE
jgi:hypothetical protein